MKVKKVILKTAITATFLAVTVPLSYASCNGGCPISELSSSSSQENLVTPDNASCLLQDNSSNSNGNMTGGAAPINNKNKVNSRQFYAYPDSVYGNSNASFIGDHNNSTTTGNSIGNALGVFLQNTDGQTGAAANIIGDNLSDKLKANPSCQCGNNNVMIQSPTSMEVTKKSIEPLKLNYNGSTTGAAANFNTIYPDVKPNYWASSEINNLTNKCVLEGYPSGFFKPDKDVTRAELASMVTKGFNLENIPLSSDGDFNDVPQSHWAYEQINRGATSDMIEGYSNNEFKPNSSVTRAEAMTIMSKGLKCPMDNNKAEEILSKYSDSSKVPSWARESVAKAIDNGALNYSQHGKKINPNASATRAEVATMLQNIRIAGGYDTNTKTTYNNIPGKTYVEREAKMEIPTLELTMKDMINAKNANVGEQFAATTINPITIGGNTFPAGSRVNGKITEIIRPTKHTQGAIRMSFNEIVGANGEKYTLPKQVLSARVENNRNVNGLARAVQWPFTWTGSIIGTVGRSAGGILIGAGNACENVLDNFGVGSSELITGNFKASGRSFQDSGKALVKAPIDVTRTALSGTLGIFQTTADEVAYLVDAKGQTISQVNPNQKITIAFGQ